MQTNTDRIWLVTAGRAGSVLLTRWYEYLGWLTVYSNSRQLKHPQRLVDMWYHHEGPLLAHDHGFEPPGYTIETHCISVERKQTWRQAVSWLIMRKHRDPLSLRSIDVEPFEIPMQKLQQTIDWIHQVNRKHHYRAKRYQMKFSVVYFEDIISSDTLPYIGLDQRFAKKSESKSSYRPEDLILNWKDLENEFQR